jgi:tetratricopeptide (TPR) repeat protein
MKVGMPIFGKKDNQEYRQAAHFIAEGKFSEAIELLRKILKENPRNFNAKTSLAIALMEIQQEPDRNSLETTEAIVLLDDAASIDMKNPVPLFNKGVLLRKLGSLEEALKSFLAAVDIEKRQPLALIQIAEINYELERWESAVYYARQALIRDPGLEGALTWVRDAMIKGGLIEDDINPADLLKMQTE